MKVDTSKLKKGSSDLTPECRLLIDQMTKCRSRAENLEFLKRIQVWVYGKCELYHWIEILDRFDTILEEAARHVNGNEFVLNCDTFSVEDTHLLLLVLNFTTLLIEHSFSRHLYNSIEHLTQLLSSRNMDIVLAVLNLLYMFSKRSNFIPRLPFEKKETLLIKLFNIAERWGDPNYGLALIDCCLKKPKLEFLYQLFIEYMDDNGQIALLEIPDMMDVCNSLTTSEVVKIICDQMSNPSDAIKMRIAHRARLISGFKDCKLRLQFVQARLQAVSVLIYSNALQDNTEKVLYPGFGEELCELIDKEDILLVDIRAAVLRTLTSMLHFDRNHNVPKPGSRLPKIIHYTGAERQGGILPLLVRDCISSLTGCGTTDKYPLTLATSLFSLLYHLASYEAGGQALVKSGMMQSLLRVINWPGVDLEHITFVTRAVRVIDLITNIDIAKFHQNNGLTAFIDRLEKEVNICREAIASSSIVASNSGKLSNKNESGSITSEDADEIMLDGTNVTSRVGNISNQSHSSDIDVIFVESANEESLDGVSSDQKPVVSNNGDTSAEQNTSASERYPSNSYYSRPLNMRNAEQISLTENQQTKKLTCVTQRAALLKSMLNFLKKSIQDHAHFNGMRNIMETSLPCSLRHIISNAEFYGPSLFLLATDVVTVYVFNEPSLLSSLQDSGITNVMLKALLHKAVPATREVLGSLPNVFSALCLNERGLMEFMSYQPFDKLLKVLLSPDYLVAMRRRRSSDPLGDTATNLGNAMDDLMKHHPYLRTDATEAIVRLLNELVRLGTDPNFICWRANKDNSNTISASNSSSNINTASSANIQQQNLSNTNVNTRIRNNDNENDSSGDDDDDDEEMSSASQQQQQRQNRTGITAPAQNMRSNQHEREAIPLIDYILNVMKFIEATFSNSSNGEHCREFVLHGGLKPLLKLLSLPNLPVDSPVSTTAQAVANVCKSILNLAHETKVIDTALQQLSLIVGNLQPLIKHANLPGGSILLRELLTCPKLEDGFSNADYTPLLHNMSSVHGYVVMLVHICRNASTEMRTILLRRWGSNCESGLKLLQNLVQLYISLVWESTVLLSLCSDEPIQDSSDLSWDEVVGIQLTSKDAFDLNEKEESTSTSKSSESSRKPDKAAALKPKIKPEEQLRYIKSLLAASSRLGRALAELFGTLVKLSVGTPQSRQRRNNDYLSTLANSKFPSADSKEIARVLSSILVNGFCHESLMTKPAPKLKLTFLICSVGFTGPMLFDDKRSCFHLMVSQFCEENGLQAFFDMFYWTLSIGTQDAYKQFSYESCLKLENIFESREDDENDFPEGTGEFLDAWLQLLEKMVNPRAILDSPYALATSRQQNLPDSMNFEPIFYLVQVHQLAMLAIKRIWKRKPIPNYGVSMTETIMAILKHLIKSNNMLSERFQARLSEITESKSPGQNKKPQHTSGDEVNVSSEHLRILLDMGFLRQHVLEALHGTNSLEQATDYLLNHPEASVQTSSREPSTSALNASSSCSEMDIDTSALSSAVASNVELNLPSEQYLFSRNKKSYSELQLISNETINQFCLETLERTFSFMEFLPETVNTGADLLSVLYRRQSSSDKEKFVLNLVQNINEWAEYIMDNMKPILSNENSIQEDLITGLTATKLFIRLKVATLLLDEMYSDMRKELCNAICKQQTLGLLFTLLNKTKSILEEEIILGLKPISPRWLQSLIEFMDAIDSVSVILQRNINMRAVCSDTWKWYDTSTGKWNFYSEANNAMIKNAFNAGDRSVIINIGRQRYTINFNCMTQVSEASGSHRPVMPALKITEAIAMTCSGNSDSVENIITRIIKSDSDMDNVSQHETVLSLSSMLNFNEDVRNVAETVLEKTEEELEEQNFGTSLEDLKISADTSKKGNSNNSKPIKSTSTKRDEKIVLYEEPTGLSKYDTCEIISCIVGLLKPSLLLNFEIKLSLLKLCARLTKDHENAKAFVAKGGIELLLKMQQSCGLMGFPTFAIIIIRHIMEAPAVLQESIERILSARTAQTVPIGHRDLLFVLTQVSSAVARDPKIFLAASKQTLRGDYVPSPSFSIDDSKFLIKAQTTSSRKGLNSSSTESPEEDLSTSNVSVKVVKDLLFAIVQPCPHYGSVQTKDLQINAVLEQQETQPVSHSEVLTDNLSSTSVSSKQQEKYEPCCCSWHIPSSSHNHQKPVLPRATLIKVLADAVRSYQSLVPRIIIGHIYTPSDSILIKKERSCLSFILDTFLPIVNREQDAEVSTMSRVLISSLVDCYGYTSVQNKVAEEVHEAIVRTLSLSESTEKHIRLQVLIGLLPMMIESPMLLNKIHVQRNNMYRILLRQGIMTDLSKIAQYSDLSNSNTFSTIFSLLRPMEILLRLTVAPGALSSKRILFGNAAQGGSAIANRRFYPRLTSRSNASTSSTTISGDNVLRDIIRNVLSDRRHGFEFIFNPEDFIADSEDSPNAASMNADDENEDNERSTEVSSASNHANTRSQLNFDRILDDFMHNERDFQNLRLINRNTNTGSTSASIPGVAVMDHHRHSGNNIESSNNDNGAGGSDGASTSSETVAAAVDNVTLGDVSTSDSNDSDSNVSTENEDRNDEEDDDEDDEDEGNEEGAEDPSETDAEDETRQFIEVFDHIYERESSETASNDADVDADDEASEVGGGLTGTQTIDSGSIAPNHSEAHISNDDRQNEQSSLISTEQLGTSLLSAVTEATNNTQSTAVRPEENEAANSVRTTPTSAWIAPRMAMIGSDGYISYGASIDFTPNVVANEIASTVNTNGDRSENGMAPASASLQSNNALTNTQNISTNIQRREPTRRLVFIDQQYCAPMPSFSNPTEEGQIELFNQDALHWWLEEAKHLDFESQTDACLYVGHLLIPFLINELKSTQKLKKKTESSNTSLNASSLTNRRSAIPVLIQQTANTAVPSVANTTTTANIRHTETSQFRIPQSLRGPRSTSSSRLDQQSANITGVGEVENDNEVNSQVFVFGNSSEEPDTSNTTQEITESNVNENSLNETLEISAINRRIEQEIENSELQNEALIDGEVEDDNEDDFEDEEDAEDEEDEMNTTFIEEDEINSTFNVEFDSAAQNVIPQQNSQSRSDNTTDSENREPSSISERMPVQDESSENNHVIAITSSLNTTDGDSSDPIGPTLEMISHESSTAVNEVIDAPAASSESSSIPEMSSEVRAALGGLEVPEGVDPSFLAALPADMRVEVIQEHLRMQRVRQRAQQNAIQVAHDSLLEVNPEFLAALPPNIQSEVLMQQRIEQQRQAAQSANPEDPVDPAAFFQNLPDSLRQAILTDMDESQIASLPPELAAEAQYLRRDWESRNGARLDANQTNTLSASARGGYLTARFPSTLQNLSEDSRWHTNSIWYDSSGTQQTQHHHHTTIVHQHHQQLHGKPIALLLMEDENKLLDPDSLTTLLLFLFIEDPKINFSRLHRVVRNLCYHLPTRDWIVNALISIIQRTNEEKPVHSNRMCIKPQWLKLRVDAAFGYKSNVFFINKVKDDIENENNDETFSNAYAININPQAAQIIVRNCLDMLFVLAKHFPRSFVPYSRENKISVKPGEPATNFSSNETIDNIPVAVTITTDSAPCVDSDMSSEDIRSIFQRHNQSTNLSAQRQQIQRRQVAQQSNDFKLDECPSTSKAAAAVRNMQKANTNCNKSKNLKGLKYNTNGNNFWDVLINIDLNSQQRLNNLQAFPINSQPFWEWEFKNPDFLSFNESPFAKLLEMLPYKVICRSPQLTDMLVKLLASLSGDLPRDEENLDSSTLENAELTTTAEVSKEEKLTESDTSSDDEDKKDIFKNQTSSKLNKSRRKIYSKNFSQLQLVIEVLTHQCGTTEGLDNVSKLIVNLSQCSEASNAIFLQYLTAAILGLAHEVRQSIQDLLNELRNFKPVSAEAFTTIPATESQLLQQQGVMQDRFTAESVVISAPVNIKPSFELQLPAMKKLLSASSAQPYFLRTLKIFIQVRDLFDTQETAENTPTSLNCKPTLSQIIFLDDLWNTLSECLVALEDSKDEYAVLVLQPTVEAFFLIHASHKKDSSKNQGVLPVAQGNNSSESHSEDSHSGPVLMDLETPSASSSKTEGEETPSDSQTSHKTPSENASVNPKEEQLKLDRYKFLSFAEKHRTVLNQILRQSPTHLSDGPFAVLVDHTRILDFDVKRKYFQTELERTDEGVRREENTVSVRRVTVFEDSFRVLYRLGPEEWKNRFYIVFEDEEGQDAGGLLREWYVIISREIFNPMYALFCVSPGDRVTYMINPSSHANPNHLSYFKFVGRVIAKAIHDNKLLECYFTRSFYKHILGKQVKYTDMESQDYEFYKGLDYLMKNDISTLGYELTFSTEVQEFGVTQVRDLIPNGRDIPVTEENKFDYVQLVCQLKMSGSIRQQLDAFLEGFYDIIPKHLISIFNEQELELLISGLPDIDIEDLKVNTEYHKYTSKSVQIQWFWRALRSFDQADRAKFLQFVTGTSKVPLQGFRSLEGMNGIQKFQIHRDDRSTDRLPCAHTCFNQLDLPMYKSYDKLRSCLLKAIHECSEGFGFA